MNRRLNLKYKGERKYLHGSDFFNTLSRLSLELLGEVGFVEKLVFKKFAVNACVLVDEKPEDVATIVAQARLKSNISDLTKEYWIQENVGLVENRYDFNEDALVAQADLDLQAKCITLTRRSNHTPIEEVIALTKKLNNDVSPNVPGKWVFGQLNLLKPLEDDYGKLHIGMVSLIKDRFSVNEIMLDDELVGTMRFIVGAPA